MKQATVVFGDRSYTFDATTIGEVVDARVKFLEAKNRTTYSSSDRAAITAAYRQMLDLGNADYTAGPSGAELRDYDPKLTIFSGQDLGGALGAVGAGVAPVVQQAGAAFVLGVGDAFNDASTGAQNLIKFVAIGALIYVALKWVR
jgi:hypothetical protein